MTETKSKSSITIPLPTGNKLQMLMIGALVVASFIIGSLWTKIQYLERGGTAGRGSTTTSAGAGRAAAPQAFPPEDASPQKVSVDDDPVLGDKNAELTMIEFVDFECPFCKRFFDETLPQIKKEYIDTGKVKLVMRDLPLSFHQNAHKESQAAECAREQGGDSAYYKYHDEIFKRTTSNGIGLALDQLPVISSALGLNSAALQKCLDSEKYKAEVDNDLSDSATAGATGTPTFFIGKTTSSGTIEGTKIVGAQPFSAFKTAIETALK